MTKQEKTAAIGVRLFVWSFAVIGVQVCWWFELGRWSVVFCLLIILGLLWTTPGDAKRLPRGISEVIILCGSFSPQQHGGWVFLRLGIVALMLLILRVCGKTAWWAVLFAWF